MVAPHRATGRNKAPLNAGLSIFTLYTTTKTDRTA